MWCLCGLARPPPHAAAAPALLHPARSSTALAHSRHSRRNAWPGGLYCAPKPVSSPLLSNIHFSRLSGAARPSTSILFGNVVDGYAAGGDVMGLIRQQCAFAAQHGAGALNARADTVSSRRHLLCAAPSLPSPPPSCPSRARRLLHRSRDHCLRIRAGVWLTPSFARFDVEL